MRSDTHHAVWIVTLVWSVLLAGGRLLGPRLGRDAATCAAFAAATLIVCASRSRRRRNGPTDVARAIAATVLGLATGYASYPAWALAIAAAGTALGLAPGAAVPPGAGTPLLWLSAVGLAPLFEELLYRERLLAALRGATGTLPAVLVSSAAFALPHVEAWPLLATFGVGLALAALRLSSGSVAACIGVHAGLNLAALLCGVPPSRRAPAPEVGAALGLALVAAIILLCRIPRDASSEHQTCFKSAATPLPFPRGGSRGAE